MTIPMQALQRADRALGWPASLALQPLRWRRSRRAQRPVRRALLVKFWGIGSLQLLTPAVRALRARHPRARLELLTLAPNAGFARGLGAFDEVLTLDVARVGWAPLGLRIAALLRQLRARGYDAVYDFEFFTRFSAVVSLACGAPQSHGFASPDRPRAGLHTATVAFDRTWHVARNFRALAGGEDGSEVGPGELLPYAPAEAERLETATALFEHGLAASGPLVVLNPHAGALSLERRWPLERFAEVARRLVLEDGARAVVIGTADEAERSRELCQRAGPLPEGRLVSLAGRLSIGATAALLDAADALVTNDSGPMHVAAALGTPTIGLFGPETPVMYRPLGERARWLWAPPTCSPCINVHDNKLLRCVRGHPECMTNLAPAAVLGVVRAELARPRRRAERERISAV